MVRLDPLQKFATEVYNNRAHETVYLKVVGEGENERVTVVQGRGWRWLAAIGCFFGLKSYDLGKISEVFKKQYESKTFDDKDGFVKQTFLDCLTGVNIGNSYKSEEAERNKNLIQGLAQRIIIQQAPQVVADKNEVPSPDVEVVQVQHEPPLTPKPADESPISPAIEQHVQLELEVPVQQANSASVQALAPASDLTPVDVPEEVKSPRHLARDQVEDSISFIMDRRDQDGFKEAIGMFIQRHQGDASFKPGEDVKRAVVDENSPLKTEADVKLFFTYLAKCYQPDLSGISENNNGKIGKFVVGALASKLGECLKPTESQEKQHSNWKTFMDVVNLVDILKSKQDSEKNKYSSLLLEIRILMKLMQRMLDRGDLEEGKSKQVSDGLKDLWKDMGFSEDDKEHIFSKEQLDGMTSREINTYYSGFLQICKIMENSDTSGNSDAASRAKQFNDFKQEFIQHIQQR